MTLFRWANSFVALATLLLSSLAAAEVVDYRLVVDEIHHRGDQAIASYNAQEGMESGDLFSDLYFDLFEGRGMERQIAISDVQLKTELETYFNAVIGQAMRGASREKVEAAWQTLRLRLDEVAKAQSTTAMADFSGVMLQSFFILLREGFEAMLVVMALVAYLRRTAPDKVRVIWHGVGWALLASGVTAWLITSVYEVSGAAREALEGATMLLAAAVLFYVSYWLISKREADRWKEYINNQIDKAVAKGSLYALGFAAFLAVYREGAETVLFYQALALGAAGQTTALISGFLLALIVLTGLFWLMRSASMKIPMGAFFTVTAALLYYLAFVFVGKGVLELQEAGWLEITPLEWVPIIDLLGVYPTAEGLLAQCLFLLPALLALYLFWRRRAAQLSGAGIEELAKDKRMNHQG
jgi:high-affinity iron transporter